MLLGVSGKSYAFLIGQKFGLPFDVIKEAKIFIQRIISQKLMLKLII